MTLKSGFEEPLRAELEHYKKVVSVRLNELLIPLFISFEINRNDLRHTKRLFWKKARISNRLKLKVSIQDEESNEVGSPVVFISGLLIPIRI
jgi:hypothetical protein